MTGLGGVPVLHCRRLHGQPTGHESGLQQDARQGWHEARASEHLTCQRGLEIGLTRQGRSPREWIPLDSAVMLVALASAGQLRVPRSVAVRLRREDYAK